jgi:signal transduction histidine kinase
MPAAVAVLGVLSLAMLVSADRISERQRSHFGFFNALMALRITVATSHLWLEEASVGQSEAELERAWADLREANRLSRVLVEGGEAGHGWIVEPSSDPERQRLAEEIATLTAEWAAIFQTRRERWEIAGLGSALESRSDAIFDQLQRRAEALGGLVERGQAADHGRSRSLVYAILLAWASIVLASVIGLVRRERRRMQAEEALCRAKDDLEVEVGERTAELRSVNHELRLQLGEREKAEAALKESGEQLQRLSASLLTAQETERKRISAELHDELGHSLVVMKLRLNLIRQNLHSDQTAVKEECHTLLQYIDQVVEDVRRLARDLSPAVLEDLGLSGALRWLAGNYVGNRTTHVLSAVEDVDHLVPPDSQILLYRIVQEALTNVGKHSQAQRVRLGVERYAGRLSFVVEDDGRGFDPGHASRREASGRGLGLTTMQERARMLGGALRVSSEEGQGTRVSVDIPLCSLGEAR